MQYIRQQKGFLMIEVMIAIIIISVALIAVTGMFIQSTRANSSGLEISTATALAQKQMEMLKSWSAANWTALTPLPQVIAWQDAAEPAMPLTRNNIAYTVVTTAAASAQDANLVQVTVSVTWLGQNLSMVSLFSRVAF